MSKKVENMNIIDLPDINQNPIDSNVKGDFNELLNPKKGSTHGTESCEKRLLAKIRRNAYVFPFILIFWAPALCFVTYYAAVSAKHVHQSFHISATLAHFLHKL